MCNRNTLELIDEDGGRLLIRQTWSLPNSLVLSTGRAFASEGTGLFLDKTDATALRDFLNAWLETDK